MRGPNLYGWVGLIGFFALSLIEQSFWPIGIFLVINGAVGLTAWLITGLIDRRHG